MTCEAMLFQEVLYGVDGLRGVLTSGFVFDVATDFAVPWHASPRSYSGSALICSQRSRSSRRPDD